MKDTVYYLSAGLYNIILLIHMLNIQLINKVIITLLHYNID